MRHCTRCALLNSSEAIYCISCGATLPQSRPNGSVETPNGYSYQPDGGQPQSNQPQSNQPQPNQPQPNQPQSNQPQSYGYLPPSPYGDNFYGYEYLSERERNDYKMRTILFAFFLGGIGGHKFYTRRIGQGVIYLLFCWTFIPAAVAFIEAVRYCCLTTDQFIEVYGQIEHRRTYNQLP